MDLTPALLLAAEDHQADTEKPLDQEHRQTFRRAGHVGALVGHARGISILEGQPHHGLHVARPTPVGVDERTAEPGQRRRQGQDDP